MKWLERWRAIPVDVRAAYVSTAGYVSWLVLLVVVGVDLALWLMACVIYPWLGLLALVLGCRLLFREHRLQRLVALLLVSGCIMTWWHRPVDVCMDLHLIGRVYAAGGPQHVNDWAQAQMGHQLLVPDQSRRIEFDEMPPGVRTHLAGFATVGDTIWSDVVQLRIELGGGFYHYGIVVYPTELAPAPKWWQTLLGWPPELVIYHE